LKRRKVIIVTDGDEVAKETVETATKNINGCCVLRSAGNPTPLQSDEIIDEINKASHDPVVVMVDDGGDPGVGYGERIIFSLVNNPDIDVIGVVAIASNSEGGDGVEVDISVDKHGKVIKNAVDKYGNEIDSKVVKGDTLSILKKLNIPVIVGVGDPGKMDCNDNSHLGAPVTTKAFQEILNRSGNT